jgi:hypothetical protein
VRNECAIAHCRRAQFAERTRADFAFLEDRQKSKALIVATSGIPVNRFVEPVDE